MANPETTFKNKITPLLKAIPNSWWVKIQQVSISGTPDILGTVGGRFVALELKSTEKSFMTALQRKALEDITMCGGYARRVYPENWEVVYGELKGLLREP